MTEQQDKIYADAKQKVKPFRFDDKVASVFDDMISRSVPSYRPILAMLPTITQQFRRNNGNYYDLGCSLGAGLHAMAEGTKHTTGFTDIRANLIGIDTSSAMLERARDYRCPYENLTVSYLQEDLLTSNIHSAAMVLMNFTLQFIAIEKRQTVIEKCFAGLNDGGALILSEKVNFLDSKTNQLLIDIHHGYKAEQGYSQLEISQKRDAIENVLIPETLDTHLQRLKSAGFSVVVPWLQNLQFISILAVK